MSVFADNLCRLPEQAQEVVQNARGDAPLQIVTAASGDPTARWNGRYLHSPRDPRREAYRLIEHAHYGDGQVVLFYGFGLGYTIETFLEAVPDGVAIVAEPDLASFAQALTARRLGGLLSSERLILLLSPDPETVAMLLRQHEERPISELRQQALYQKSTAEFDRIEAAYANFRSRSQVNANTLKRFGKIWVRNLVRNLPLLDGSPGVRTVFNSHRGEPVLVAAGGPSIERVLPALPEAAKRMRIVAVDTALPLLLRVGVEPDYVVSVDPQYWNTRHLDSVQSCTAPLVSESSTHPLVFRRLRSTTYFCSSLFPLGRYFEQWLSDRGTLGAGGSVSTTAWDFARQLGCTPIFFAGLDLGFPERMTHYRGSFFEERIHTVSRRFRPAEGYFRSYLYSGYPKPVPSNQNGTVLTDERMLVYKWWFENQLKMHPRAATYNLSADGVAVQGMPYCSVEEMLSMNGIQRSRPRRKRGESTATSATNSREQRRQALGALRRPALRLLEELTALEEIAARGVREIDDAGANSWSRLNSVLDRVDAEIRSFPHRDVVGFLLQAPLREVVQESAHDQSAEAVRNRTHTIYLRLKEATHYHRTLLENALSRFP